jgi:hypothetical protein
MINKTNAECQFCRYALLFQKKNVTHFIYTKAMYGDRKPIDQNDNWNKLYKINKRNTYVKTLGNQIASCNRSHKFNTSQKKKYQDDTLLISIVPVSSQ